MATTAELEARIVALEKLRANGYARVTYEGHTVEYRSLTEIDSAIASLRAQLATARATPLVRQIYVQQPDKGL